MSPDSIAGRKKSTVSIDAGMTLTQNTLNDSPRAICNFIGKNDKGERMEIIELKHTPWFVGMQFHP